MANTKTAPALIGLATPEEIEAWKKAPENELGIFGVEIDGRISYHREPDLTDMNIAMSGVGQDNLLDFNVNVGRETCIGGCRELFEDRKYQRRFVETIKTKLEAKRGKLVDL